MKNNYSIVISSCEKFEDIWLNAICLLNKYWTNHPEYIILTDRYSKPYNFNVFSFDAEFSSRLIALLEKCESKYIVFTLDDYFINSDISSDSFEYLITFMINYKVDYLRLYKTPRVKGKTINRYFKKIPLKKTYEVNFYPSIWKKDALISVLKENENIWFTEVNLAVRSRKNRLICFTTKTNSFFPFTDGIRKGKYLPQAIKLLKKENLIISKRDIISKKELLYLFFKTVGSTILPPFAKRIAKRIIRKKGGVIYSDYEEK